MAKFKVKRKIAKNMILLLLFLIISEGISRLIFNVEAPYYLGKDGVRTSRDHVFDKQLMYRMKPNLDGMLISTDYIHNFKTDSLGFRGNNNYTPDSEGIFTIMSHGDHFTVGRGVELSKTYTELLKKKINVEYSMPVKAWNFGIGGFGIMQQINLYKQFSYLNPDLIIMTLFVRDNFSYASKNDLVTNYIYDRFLKRQNSQSTNGIYKNRKKQFTMKDVRSFLFHNFNLYRIIRFAANDILRRNFTPPDNIELKKIAWQLTFDALLKLDNMLEGTKAKCILLWIPFIDTIVQQDHSVTKRIELLNLKNIYFIDPLEELKDHPESYYFPLDNHWTDKAHFIAADLLYLKMISENLEPSPIN